MEPWLYLSYQQLHSILKTRMSLDLLSNHKMKVSHKE